jgi:hypothetical protein
MGIEFEHILKARFLADLLPVLSIITVCSNFIYRIDTSSSSSYDHGIGFQLAATHRSDGGERIE